MSRILSTLAAIAVLAASAQLADPAQAAAHSSGRAVAPAAANQSASSAAVARVRVSFRNRRLVVLGTAADNDLKLKRSASGRLIIVSNVRLAWSGRLPMLRNVRSIRIYGGPGHDRISLQRGVQGTTMYGGADRDVMRGNTAVNVFHGQSGNDAIFAGGGDDLIHGERGNDTIYAQEGNDRVWGADGNDRIDPGLGDDRVRGGAGDDHYALDAYTHRRQGHDALGEAVDEGRDTISLSDDDSTFSLATSAEQRVNRYLGVQLLRAGNFENVISGQGKDVLTGNAQDNRIEPGFSGRPDTVTTGAGADVILIEGIPDFWLGDDTVTDFSDNDAIEKVHGQVVTGFGTTTLTISGRAGDGTLTSGNGRPFTEADVIEGM